MQGLFLRSSRDKPAALVRAHIASTPARREVRHGAKSEGDARAWVTYTSLHSIVATGELFELTRACFSEIALINPLRSLASFLHARLAVWLVAAGSHSEREGGGASLYK